MKVGYQGTWMVDNRVWMTNDTELDVPRQQRRAQPASRCRCRPYQNDGRAGWHAGFAQEQWTRGRLTLQGALRFDLASSWFPEQTLGPSKYFPTQIVFPATKGVDSYNGLHAANGSGLRRLRQRQDGASRSTSASTSRASASRPTTPTRTRRCAFPTSTGPFGVQGVTRAWTDADGDFVPDCDLNNLGNQDLRAGRRRPLRRRLERALGPERADEQLRPEPAQGLGRASVGLELRRLGPAADPPPDVGRGGLPPPLVRRLHGAGQHAGRPTPSTTPSASPRRSTRALPGGGGYVGVRPLRRHADQVRPDPQQRDRLAAPSARRRRSSTAWTSRSTCARAA